MEIVIYIPEETYMHLRNGGNIGASLMIEDAIKNGTPLPKGHGDLIDVDSLDIPVNIHDGFEAMAYIEGVDPIIGADNGEEEQ